MHTGALRDRSNYNVRRAGSPPLARIGDSLLLEVLIDAAALHEIAPHSTHRADDDFLALDGGSRTRARPFYKKSE
jgi:hypothetical protein